jgi:hypothetical protein
VWALIGSSVMVCVGLLWKPCVGCRTGEVELSDNNSGASWNKVIDRWKMLRERLDSETAYLREIYACQALLG